MAHQSPVRTSASTPGSSLPDKLYFRIGEVARLCEVPAYVLRFWESEFPQLKPNKGGTGQRLYRQRDVEMALRIKGLLYDEGYTIPGARHLLKGEQKQKEPQLPLVAETSEALLSEHLQHLRQELRELLEVVSGVDMSQKTALPRTSPPSNPVRQQMDSLFDFDAVNDEPGKDQNR